MKSRFRFDTHTIALISILLTGIVIRLIHLGDISLWYDEACVYLQLQVISKVIHLYAVIHPPLYFVILYLWTLIAGTSETALRLPSVFFSSISIYLIYLSARNLFNRRVALIAAGLTAFSPFHIYYAQQVKMYSMTIFFYSLSFYFISQLIVQRRAGTAKKSQTYRIGFSHLLLYYGNAMSFLGVIANNIWFFVFRNRYKKEWVPWIIVNVIAFCAAIPLFILWSSLVGLVIQNRWVNPVTFKTFLFSFRLFTAGFYMMGLPMWIVTGACGLAAAYGLFRLRKDIEILSLLIITLVFPVLFSAEISMIQHSIYLERTFLFVTIPLYIIIAYGFSRFKPAYVQGIVFIVLALCVRKPLIEQLTNEEMPFNNQTACSRMENKNAAAIVKKMWKPGDLILHTNPQSVYPFLYYLPWEEYEGYQVIKPDETPDQVMAFHHPEFPHDRLRVLFNIWNFKYKRIDKAVSGRHRIWLVAGNYGVNDQISPYSQWMLDWLNKWGHVTFSRKFRGLRLYLFEKSSA